MPPLLFRAVVLVGLLFFVVNAATHAAQPTGKPRSPVSVTISPETGASDARTVSFVVAARTLIEAEQFAVNVQPPAGARLLEGALSWLGPLQAGSGQTLRFTLAMPETGPQHVFAIARILDTTGPSYAAHAIYRAANSGATAKARASLARPALRSGRPVMEYPLK